MLSNSRWKAVITPAMTTVFTSQRTIGVVSKSRW